MITILENSEDHTPEPVGTMAERCFGTLFIQHVRNMDSSITSEDILRGIVEIEYTADPYFDLLMTITRDLAGRDGIDMEESIQAMDKVFLLISGYAAAEWLKVRR